MLRLAIVLTSCLVPRAFAFQSVHVVQGGGSALQTAITSAVDGDTLLVRAGTYAGCTIDGKGLAIVSDAPGSTIVDSIRVQNTAAGQKVVVSGFLVRTPSSTEGPPLTPRCIVLTNCADSVRLEALTNQILTPNSSDAVYVENCVDVALSRCTLTGSNGTSVTSSPFSATFPGAGLRARGSQVAAHDSVLRGGDGNDGFYHTGQVPFFPFPPTDGAPGVDVVDSATFASNSGELRGGAGGNGLPGHCSPTTGLPVAGGPARDGGEGVRTAAGAQSFALGSLLQGGLAGVGIGGSICTGMPAVAGSNGLPGTPSSGALTTFSGTATTLAYPTRVRSGEPIGLTITGSPGDVVFLALSLQSRFDLNPFYEGTFLFGPTARRAVLGIIPGSGTLAASIPSEALPAGVLARHRQLQVLSRDLLGSLQLGSFGVVSILDPGL